MPNRRKKKELRSESVNMRVTNTTLQRFNELCDYEGVSQATLFTHMVEDRWKQHEFKQTRLNMTYREGVK